jgi:hypothetical protein
MDIFGAGRLASGREANIHREGNASLFGEFRSGNPFQVIMIHGAIRPRVP